MDSNEDDFLGGSDDDDSCIVSGEREEELLQDDDSTSNDRHFERTQRREDVFSNEEPEDDVLNLELEEEFIEDKIEDVEPPKREDKFKSERLPNPKPTDTLKPQLKKQQESRIQTQEFCPVATHVSYNKVQRGFLRQRGGTRGNFRNYPRNQLGYNRDRRPVNRGTVYINPSYQGSVQVSNNNARLAWDSQGGSNGNVQPWASSQLQSNQQQQLFTGLLGLVSNLQNRYQPQEEINIFQPTPSQVTVFQPPPQQFNFQPPPQRSDFQSPSQQSNFQLPSQQTNFQPPPAQTNFNSPPPQHNFQSPLLSKPPLFSNPPSAPLFANPPPPYYSKSDDGGYRKINADQELVVFPPITTVPPPPLVPQPLFAPYHPPMETTGYSSGPKFNNNSTTDEYSSGPKFNTDASQNNYYNKQSFRDGQDSHKRYNQNLDQNRSYSLRNDSKIRTNFQTQNQDGNVQCKKTFYHKPENFNNNVLVAQSKPPLTKATETAAVATPTCDEFDEEDEEMKTYRMKIEQQKKERERVLKMKEDRRLQQSIANPSQDLDNLSSANINVAPQTTTKISNNTTATIKKSQNVRNKKLSIHNNIILVPAGQRESVTTAANADDDLLQSFKINVSNSKAVKPPEAAPSGFIANRRFVMGGSNGSVTSAPAFEPVTRNAVVDEEIRASSFFSSRMVISKDPSLLHTRIVKVFKLPSNTKENELREMAGGIGEIQKLQISREEGQATILFKNVASAHMFFKKYRHHTIGLSKIDVKLEPMI